MWKLCLSTKFPHYEIRGNYDILDSDSFTTVNFVTTLTLNDGIFSHVSKLSNYFKFSEEKCQNITSSASSLNKEK